MPTPVSAARQCLTSDAARALDDAAAVARRRGHAQTTSLHAVAALLALPSSLLREACARARSFAFSPRYQLRALELCFAAALDRLPAAQTLDDPPVSNSLMAAIKRSQAGQRRNPDASFNYQQHSFHHDSAQPGSSSSSSVLLIKVELRHLVLSILDDPVVSRVFGEAGFRSTDIKLEIIRPAGPRFPRPRCPPLFLCNFEDPNVSDFNDSSRRICEVLVKNRNKNPFLIGVSAREAVRNFRLFVEVRSSEPAVPRELAGVMFVCVEKEVREGSLKPRFEELGRLAAGPGVVIDIGELKASQDDRAAIAEVARLLKIHREERLWLVGSASNYETYMKFLNLYPTLEKDWDLHLLPITSTGPGLGRPRPWPDSLLESSVPFGECFSSVSDLKGLSRGKCQPLPCCHIRQAKYEGKVAEAVKCPTFSVTGQKQAMSPSSFQRSDIVGTKISSHMAKAEDVGAALRAKSIFMQNVRNDMCIHLHRDNRILEPEYCWVGPQFLANVTYSCISDQKEGLAYENRRRTTIQNQSDCQNGVTALTDRHNIVMLCRNMSVPMVAESKDEKSLLSQCTARISESKEIQKYHTEHAPRDLSNLDIGDGQASPSSVTSVTTDLMLGTTFVASKKQKRGSGICQDKLKDLRSYSHFEACTDPVVKKGRTAALNNGGDCSDTTEEFDPRDSKSLWRTLTEKIGRQEDAICAISQTISHCKAGTERRRGSSLRGDIWFTFMGPDRVAQKKIAMALADCISGSRNNLISVDLKAQDCGTPSKSLLNSGQNTSGYDSRGKTVVDYLAAEISRKPLSVVLLENVDKADILLQSSLSRAVRTGKFPDSHGREVGVNNTVFVTTVRGLRSKSAPISDCLSFSEQRILAAQAWQMRILIGATSAAVTHITSYNGIMSKNDSLGRVCVNKGKLGEFKMCQRSSNLDLNLSVGEVEGKDEHYMEEENQCFYESSEAWLQEFLDTVDARVEFQPFDFDALANNILEKIEQVFLTSTGSKGFLEIDLKCMEQILAAAWISNGTRDLDVWIEKNLGCSFDEARHRWRGLSAPLFKLVVSEDCYMEEPASGVCLPARIMLG